MKHKQMRDMTRGPVGQHLWVLMGFMVFGMFAQMLNTFVDIYFVARLGASAVAALTLSANVLLVGMALAQGLSIGSAALIAQALGRKNGADAQLAFSQALGLSIALLLGAVLFSRPIAHLLSGLLSASSDIAVMSWNYLVWFIPAIALQLPASVFSSGLRAAGTMRPVMLAQIGSVLVNVILAPLLISGLLGFPSLGVAGAGIATFVSALISFLWLTSSFLNAKSPLRIRPAEWAPVGAVWRQILSIGLPAGADFLLMFCYLTFITYSLRGFGGAEQAAFGVGQRLIQLLSVPTVALSFATAAVAGQNAGAGALERVRETLRSSILIGLAVMAISFAICEMFPRQLVEFFTSDESVQASAVTFLRVVSVNLFTTGVALSCFGVLSGLGRTMPALGSSALKIVAVVVFAVATANQMRNEGPVLLWYIVVVGTAIHMLANIYFVRKVLSKPLPVSPWAQAESGQSHDKRDARHAGKNLSSLEESV